MMSLPVKTKPDPAHGQVTELRVVDDPIKAAEGGEGVKEALLGLIDPPLVAAASSNLNAVVATDAVTGVVTGVVTDAVKDVVTDIVTDVVTDAVTNDIIILPQDDPSQRSDNENAVASAMALMIQSQTQQQQPPPQLMPGGSSHPLVPIAPMSTQQAPSQTALFSFSSQYPMMIAQPYQPQYPPSSPKTTSQPPKIPAAPGQPLRGEYRDASLLLDPPPDARRNRGGVTEPFPEKLHRMLTDTEREGLQDVVSFFSHGRAFAIHKPRRFVGEIMPRYFRQTRLTSFQRQLNLYGFQRISQGPDNGGYYHELFLRGRSGLCVNMKRTKVKGTTKTRRDPDTEPNFYAMPMPVSSGMLPFPNSAYTNSTKPAAPNAQQMSLQHLPQGQHPIAANFNMAQPPNPNPPQPNQNNIFPFSTQYPMVIQPLAAAQPASNPNLQPQINAIPTNTPQMPQAVYFLPGQYPWPQQQQQQQVLQTTANAALTQQPFPFLTSVNNNGLAPPNVVTTPMPQNNTTKPEEPVNNVTDDVAPITQLDLPVVNVGSKDDSVQV